MNAQLSVLSAIGLRTPIETICKDRGVIGRDLQKLIDGLADAGVLAKAQKERALEKAEGRWKYMAPWSTFATGRKRQSSRPR